MTHRGLPITIAVMLFIGAAAMSMNRVSTAEDAMENADTVEALFLGSGRLAPSDGFPACPYLGFWSGFPRGTTVTVRVSTTVSEDIRQAIRDALADVPEATGGAINATFELADDSDPIPGRNEVTLTLHPDPVSEGCPYKRGCTMHRFRPGRPGIFLAGRVVQPPGLPLNAYVHDVVGHGVMGMCHIDGNRIGGAEESLMSGGPGVFSGQIAIRLTPLDRDAARAMYGTSLNPGATRKAFGRAIAGRR